MKEDEYEVEKILCNSEPVFARGSNGAMPFLSQNRNAIEMTDSGQEQDPIKDIVPRLPKLLLVFT